MARPVDDDVWCVLRSGRRAVSGFGEKCFSRGAILDRVDYAARLAVKVSSGGAGELSVGTFPAADVKILPRLRPLLASRLPALRLEFHSRYAVEPLSGLRHGLLDVAFVRDPVGDAELEATELLREPLVLVVSAAHALAKRNKVPVKAVDRLPFIVTPRALAASLHDAVAALFEHNKVRVQPVEGADNVLGQLNLVQGEGDQSSPGVRRDQRLRRNAPRRQGHGHDRPGVERPDDDVGILRRASGPRRRPSLLYCGDNDDAKSVVAQLIRDVGFEPVDAGPLRIARYLEPFTLAIAQLAYEGDEGPELAYRIERFGK